VDEGQLLGRHRSIETVGALNELCTDTSALRIVYKYDTQGRLISAASSDSVTTFSKWDSKGRFTESVETGAPPFFCPVTSTTRYDDGAHVVRVDAISGPSCFLPFKASTVARYSSDLVDVSIDNQISFAFGGSTVPVPVQVSFKAETTTSVCK
jgi:YD repeat-containing protein